MATAIPKACLASSAIRCRDVETGPNLGGLAVFPSNGATCRCPLPSTGVSWAQFPRFGGTMRHSDSSPPIPPRFVAALLHESELARTDPDPQLLHRSMRYDIGLPSPVI